MAQPPPTPLLPSRIGEVSLLLGTEPIFDLGDDSWLAEEPDTPKASGSSLPPRQVSPVFQGARSAIQVSYAGAVGEEFSLVAETTFEGPILQGKGEKAQDEARRLDSPAVEMRRSLSRSTSSLSSSRSGLHQRRPDRDDFFARRLSSSTSRPSSPFLNATSYRAAGSPPSLPAPLYSPSVAHTSFGSEDLEITEVKMAWKERSLPVDRPILARVGPSRTVMTDEPIVNSGVDEPKLQFNGTQRLTISKVSQIPRHTSALSQFLAGSSFASRPQPLAGPSTFQSPLPHLDPPPPGTHHDSVLGLSLGSSSFSPPPVEMVRSAVRVPNEVHEMDQHLPTDDLVDGMGLDGDPFDQASPIEPDPPLISDAAHTDRIALRSEEMGSPAQVIVDNPTQHMEDDNDIGDRSMPGAFDFQLPTLAEISDSDNSMSLADGSMSKSERRSSRLLSFFTGFLKGSGEAERLSTSVTKSVVQDQIDVDAPEPTHDEMVDTISNTTAGIRASARNSTKRSREEEAILPQDTASHIAERLSGSIKPGRQTTTRSPPRKKAAGYIPLTRPVAPFRVALQPSKTMLSANSNAQPTKGAKSSSEKSKPVSRAPTQSAFASAALARLPPLGKGSSSSARPIIVKDTERVKDLAARRRIFEGTTRPEQPIKTEGERGSSKGSISRPIPVHRSVVRTVPVSGMTPGKASRERALARRQFDDAVRTNLELKEQERRREERLRLKKEEEEYLRSRKETVIRANPVPQMYRTAREA